MHKKLRFLPILIAVLAVSFAVTLPADTAKAGNKIAEGVRLGATDLSGMTLDEAAGVMKDYCDLIASSDLTINVRNIPDDVLTKMEAGESIDPDEYESLYSVKVPLSTFDLDYDIEGALRTASSLGEKGRLIDRYKLLMDMKYGSVELPISFSVDDQKVKTYVEKLFVPENSKEARDASFGFGAEGFHVIEKEQTGIRVSAPLTTDSILKTFENGFSDKMACNAIVGTVEPEVTSDSMEDIPFSLVATYTTRFWTYDNEANLNRSHNIMKAAQYVNGTLLMPGQSCSLNQTIGQRTEARGFKFGHAYLNGRVIDSVGGGICQFATTLYQCLLQTEMTINSRHNHSMRVDYVDYSQDATLDWPGTDLSFTNSWDYPIYITCSTSFGYPSTVTVNIYGYDQRPKNRTVEYRSIIDSTEKTIYPELRLDSGRAPGNPSTSGSVLDAVSSHLEKIVRVNGAVQSTTRMNNDYYRPLRAITTVGSRGLSLEVVREGGIDQIKDGNGNYLLLNGSYAPIYNGNGGYYLAKDYKHGANNVATYSGGKLVPVGGHTHSYGSWAPNDDGTHTGTCSCGAVKTENCPYNSRGVCTKCGAQKPTEEHTHSYTWKSNGNGTHTGACSCGDAKTEKCTYDNKGICTKCGAKKQPEPTTECKHVWDGGKVKTAATCEKDGVKVYTCTKCGETKEEIIKATGHKWDNGKVTKEATCTEAGVKTFTCSACHKTRTEAIPALGHDFQNGHCTRCGAPDPNNPPTEPAPTEPAPTEPAPPAESGSDAPNP